MRVACTTDSGRDLSADHFAKGYSASSSFDLTPGKEYVVYGISLWRGLLLYLILGEGQRPAWYPAELFSVTRSEIPSGWYFAFFSPKDGAGLSGVWGYDELVNREGYFDMLAELDREAAEVFERRRMLIDEVS